MRSTGRSRSSAQRAQEVGPVLYPSHPLAISLADRRSYRIYPVATTFLTSRLTNLTTAYTLNVSNPSVPASIHDPYVLAPPVSTSPSHRPFARAGTTFFRHPSIPAERDELSLFELSDLGGLVMRKLGRITEDPADVAERMKGALRAGREGFQWQPDITHLAKTTEKEAHSDPVNHREAREVKLVDMRKRYEDVFRLPRPVKLGIKFEVVDRMEQLFTELDHPLEEMVTPSVADSLLLVHAVPHPDP